MQDIWTSIQLILGVIGFVISSFLGTLQLYSYFWVRPRLSLWLENNKVERQNPDRKYSYVNLVVRNNGRPTARKCEIRLTIPELRYDKQTLWWMDPNFARTKKEATISIRGKGGEKTTNLFELDSTDYRTVITSEQGHDAILEVGKTYTFKIEVSCEPTTRKSGKFEVVIQSWDNITVSDC